MEKEEIKKMKFNQLVNELLKFENCVVDCQHFIVRNLYDFVNSQKENIDYLISSGVDPRKDNSAKIRKRNLIETFYAIQFEKNIFKIGEKPERKIESIFVKND